LQSAGLATSGIRTTRLASGQYRVELDVQRRDRADVYEALGALRSAAGVVVVGVDQSE
jgi:hypothetical protein